MHHDICSVTKEDVLKALNETVVNLVIFVRGCEALERLVPYDNFLSASFCARDVSRSSSRSK